MENTFYALLNPLVGQYTRYQTHEECVTKLAEFALAFFHAHTHGQPVSIIKVKEDGSEEWSLPSGETVLSPEQQELAMLELAQGFFTETPVVTENTETP